MLRLIGWGRSGLSSGQVELLRDGRPERVVPALKDEAAADAGRSEIHQVGVAGVRAAKRRMRIAEIPVREPPRIGRHRKLQIWRWGAAYYFQFWRELWYWR